MKEREKKKGGKDEEVNGQGGRGVPRPHTGQMTTTRCEHVYTDDVIGTALCHDELNLFTTRRNCDHIIILLILCKTH